MRRSHVARLSLIAVLGAAAAAAVVLAFLSLTPPKAVARRMLLIVSDRALFPPSNRAARALHKLVGMYLEYAIAGKMARTAAAQPDLHDDAARIAFVLRRAQLRMLSADAVPHDAQEWPVLVAGVGYCDQVNAAICRILAHSFPRAQLFALYDPATKQSPHTVGRVWSQERNEWLYFDGFGRQVVFHKTAGGEVEILSGAATAAGALPLYRLPGWAMNEYPATYPMYVASMVRKRWRPQTKAPPLAASPPLPLAETPLPAVASAPVVAEAPPPLPDSDAAARQIAKIYVRARADDLFGDPEEAKKEYRAVAAAAASGNPKVAVLQAAAKRFGE